MPRIASLTSIASLTTIAGAVDRVLHTLNNPNAYGTPSSDEFGYSVAISGNYSIVGAYKEDDAGGSSSGKAYIFNNTTGALLHTLDNPNAYGTTASDRFGKHVGISGNYAIVGAELEDDATNTQVGKAYIFNVSTGAVLHTLSNPNPYGTTASDNFGSHVAISGNYSIVSAPKEDEAAGTDSGKAYIYNNSTGALLHTLSNPSTNSVAFDNFGDWVAISDSYAIVGVPREYDSTGTYSNSGRAYIYNNSTGALLHTLDNPNAYGPADSSLESFGQQVAISDTYAIVGTPTEDDASGNQSGKAYIFSVSTGALVHTLDNPNAYNTAGSDQFGRSVAISDTYAIVGAELEDDAGGLSSGKAYIFSVSTGALLETLNNPNPYSTSANDNFGNSVGITDTYAIVGAYREDEFQNSTSGKAYIYSIL